MDVTVPAVAAEPFDGPGPQSIVLAALDEFDRIYGEGNRGAHDLAAGDFDPPRGVYLVARVDGHLAGGAGIRPIAAPELRAGEVKRLWVRPDLRRHGVARALMVEVVERAVAIGYATLYLETGPRQPAARALYVGLGWELVDAYPQGAHTHDTGTRFRLELAPPR
ncbi:MAG TPA: GNAT family N-acetyltransferase [Acidimicrobiales bacterium]|nr:GNAT family N-acetyltransferase [Acidimicrobiales bacterium]